MTTGKRKYRRCCCESAVTAAKLGHIECLREMNDHDELSDMYVEDLLKACMQHGNFECFTWITNTLPVDTWVLGRNLYYQACKQANVAWFKLLHSLGYEGDLQDLLLWCVSGGNLSSPKFVEGGSLECVAFVLEVLELPVTTDSLIQAAHHSRPDLLTFLWSKSEASLLTPGPATNTVLSNALRYLDSSEDSIACLHMLRDAGLVPDPGLYGTVIRELCCLTGGSRIQDPMRKIKAVFRRVQDNEDESSMEVARLFCSWAAICANYEVLEYCLSQCSKDVLSHLRYGQHGVDVYEQEWETSLQLSQYPYIRKLFLLQEQEHKHYWRTCTPLKEWRAYEAEAMSLIAEASNLPTDVVKYTIMSFL